MYLTKHLVKYRLDDHVTLYVNTLSGAMDVFDDAQIGEIDSLVHCDAPPDGGLAPHLVARKYLLRSSAEERELFLALREKMRVAERREPTFLGVCPTFSCFFKCGYCYEGELTARKHASLVGPEAFWAGVEQMAKFLHEELQFQDCPYITFLGGEPLQPGTRDVVLHVLAHGSRQGYPFTIITNGYLLDLFLEDLVPYATALKRLEITLDGPPPLHDRRRPLASGQSTFARVAANIQRALDAGLPVWMRTNVDNANVEGLVGLARWIRMKGWDRRPTFRAFLAPVEDSNGRGLEVTREDELLRIWLPLKESAAGKDLLALYDDSKLFRVTDMLEANLTTAARRVLPRFSYCAATKGKSFVLAPDGRIYQCLRGVGDLRTSIGTFWPFFHIDRHAVQRWLGRDITRIQCPSCVDVATLQGGGCALESLNRNGNLESCACGQAHDVLRGYLGFRRERILEKSRSEGSLSLGASTFTHGG